MPRCTACGGYSYLPRGGQNTYIALAILFIGFSVAYSPAVSGVLFGTWPPFWSILLRIELYAIAVFIALLVFTFAGRLRALPAGTSPLALFNIKILAVEWSLFAFLLWWLYLSVRLAYTLPPTPYAS